jgi:hypothetical protein
VSGYFRKVFQENPTWLGERSNDKLLARWSADHPGQDVSKSVKQNLANLKSILRSKKRKRKAAKQSADGNAPTSAAASTTISERRPIRALEALEQQIDDCLSQARTLDREGLDGVIMALRRARNAVVWMIGQ